MLALKPDCIPCAMAGALRTSKAAGADERLQQTILKAVLRLVADWDFSLPPARLGREIQRTVRRMTANPDPYRTSKEASNRAMMALLPSMREAIEEAPDSLDRALRLAATANCIDFGPGGFAPETLEARLLSDRKAADFARYDREALDAALGEARSLLLVCDNAGEIVADRLLAETLGPERVTAVVRGGPTINDATMEDARASGLSDVARVITTGDDTPGFSQEDASPAFRRALDESDLVLVKGQGNFETLLDRGPRFFFLLMAKCLPVAQSLAVEQGSLVLARGEDRS